MYLLIRGGEDFVLKSLMTKQLIETTLDVSDFRDMVTYIGFVLQKNGFVKEGYVDAVISREEAFPTGLKTQYINIGLPHTDPEFIKKPFVFFVRNKKGISIQQMGDNSYLESRCFFFLGISEGGKQVYLLSNLMEAVQNVEFVSVIEKGSSDEIINYIKNM